MNDANRDDRIKTTISEWKVLIITGHNIVAHGSHNLSKFQATVRSNNKRFWGKTQVLACSTP